VAALQAELKLAKADNTKLAEDHKVRADGGGGGEGGRGVTWGQGVAQGCCGQRRGVGGG
jgi:hypothetical protein